MPAAPLRPLTPMTPSSEELATLPTPLAKMTRSYSVSSSSSSSSTYSRSADDMLDRLASQEPHAEIHLWSAGNIRLNGRDLTTPAMDTADLVHQLKADDRFEVVSVVYFDGDDDWKMSVRRTTVVTPPTTPGL